MNSLLLTVDNKSNHHPLKTHTLKLAQTRSVPVPAAALSRLL
jgi:hypothetical protein